METTEITNVSETTTVNDQVNAAEQTNVESKKKSGSSFGKVVMFGAVPGILLGAAGVTGAAYAVSDDFDDVVEDFEDAAEDLLGISDASAAEDAEVITVEEEVVEMGSVVEQLEAILPDPEELMAAAMGAPVLEPAVVVEEVVVDEETLAEEEAPAQEDAPEAASLAKAAVNDEMSFGAAFEAARAQVGPEGVFEWRGNYYSTYTKDEWDAMGDADRESYMHKYYDTDLSEESYVAEEEAVEEVETVEVVEEVEAVEEMEVVAEVVEEVMTVEAEEDAVFAEVDGHEAMYVDVDADGVADYVVVDSNDNGEADYDEVYNIEDEGISMDDASSADAMF